MLRFSSCNSKELRLGRKAPLHAHSFWRCQVADRAVGNSLSARLEDKRAARARALVCGTAHRNQECWGSCKRQLLAKRTLVQGHRAHPRSNNNLRLPAAARSSGQSGRSPASALRHEQATGRGGGGGQPGCPVYERRRAVQDRRCAAAPLCQNLPPRIFCCPADTWSRQTRRC